MSVETFPVTPEPTTASLRRRPLRETVPALLDGSAELSRGLALALVGVLVIISIALRLYGLHMFYWVDEGLSVQIASHPLAHIPALLRQDGSPPLYYLLLHVWMSVFGRGEAATHELSLLFALLSIPTAYWAGTSLFNRRTGFICAALAALVPFLSIYGEETRMYALMALLALLASASFLHTFVFRRRRYLPLFSVSLAACLYTHNWALFLGLISALTFLGIVWRSSAEERRGLWRDGALAFGAVAILYAPWLPTLIYQARHTGAPWDLPPVFWSLTQGVYSIVNGRGAAAAILLGSGSGLFALRELGVPGRRLRLAALSLLVLGFGTLLVAWAYSKTTPAWADRYLAVIVGPLLLLAGFGLSRAGRLGLVALVLVSSWWILDPVATSRDAKSNVGAVAARVRSKLGSGSLVVVTQPEQVATLSYYLPKVKHFGTPLGPVPDPGVMDWRNALERLRRGSVRGTLLPMVNRLPVGQHVLLVNTANLAKQPLYLKLINRDGNHWLTALKDDPNLVYTQRVTAGSSYAGVAVYGYLFTKI